MLGTGRLDTRERPHWAVKGPVRASLRAAGTIIIAGLLFFQCFYLKHNLLAQQTLTAVVLLGEEHNFLRTVWNESQCACRPGFVAHVGA